MSCCGAENVENRKNLTVGFMGKGKVSFVVVFCFILLAGAVAATVQELRKPDVRVGDVWRNNPMDQDNPFDEQLTKYYRVTAVQGDYVQYVWMEVDIVESGTKWDFRNWTLKSRKN